MTLAREAMQSGCRAPLILLTGAAIARSIEAAVRAGAADYLVKSSGQRAAGPLDPLRTRAAPGRGTSRCSGPRGSRRRRTRARPRAAPGARRDHRARSAAAAGGDSWSGAALQRQLQQPQPATRLSEGLERIAQTATDMANQLDELVAASRAEMTLVLARAPTDLCALVRQAVSGAEQTTDRHEFRWSFLSQRL